MARRECMVSVCVSCRPKICGECCSVLNCCMTIDNSVHKLGSKLGRLLIMTTTQKQSKGQAIYNRQDAIHDATSSMRASQITTDRQMIGNGMGCECVHLKCKEWCPPEGPCQNPGLLRDIGHSALDPHMATMLLHLTQKCCQQGAFTCTSHNN